MCHNNTLGQFNGNLQIPKARDFYIEFFIDSEIFVAVTSLIFLSTYNWCSDLDLFNPASRISNEFYMGDYFSNRQ